MVAFLNALGLAFDLAIVVLAFTLIIVIHELGHFVAARWAGIRVLAFAVGFGPALLSYRKGLGWRRGSSASEYLALARFSDTKIQGGWLYPLTGPAVSPTEYRINGLPFGGYVKMLGQDDSDPSATSSEPDGYQACTPWKRMVVISAGVVFNLVSAAALFVIVFMAGLKTEPPIIGAVEPGSPAAVAVATEADELAITAPGLMAGDRVLSIDGELAQSFKDLMLASAMARRGDAIALTVERAGVPRPLTFRVVPKENPATKFLQFGVGPAVSTRVYPGKNATETAQVKGALTRLGLSGVEPGMRLARVNGVEVPDVGGGGGNGAIADAARSSEGRPLTLQFVSEPPAVAGAPVTVTLPPTAKLDQLALQVTPDSAAILSHVAGLSTAMQVDSVPTDEGKAAGLLAGDVFAQIGGVEWPSQPAGVAEIRRHKGSSVHVAVARKTGEGGRWSIVDLKLVPVNKDGQIGFSLGPVDNSPLFLGAWSDLANAKGPGGETTDTPRPDTLAKLKIAPGSLLTSVAGTPVRTLGDVRVALAKAGAAATATAADGAATVDLTFTPPLTDASGVLSAPPQTVAWTPERAALQPVLWQAEAANVFDDEKFELKAQTPFEAMRMGFRETRQVVLSTYVTLLRLFQGSVKIEHLKGPVGIAHMGTMIVDRGVVWMLFFMAIVSVNLAVINFLPIPITDGGHLVFLLYEQITGRPASIAVQNATMIAGMMLVAGIFLIVTFNDITNLVTGR